MTDAAPAAKSGRVLRLVLGAVALVFVAVAARDLVRGFDPSAVHVNLLYLAAAAPFAFLACWVQASAWLHLLDAWTGLRLPRREGRALFFAAQVARYTPGKVGLPAVRLAGAKALGVSPQAMGSTLVLEVLTWLTTGGSLSGLVLALYPEVLGELGQRLAGLFWLAVVGGVLALLGLVFVDRQRLPRRVAELLHLSGSGPPIPASVVGLYSVHWLSWIAHGTLLGLALGATPANSILVGVALVLGIVAGFLAFLAPAGVGVREAVIGATASVALGAAGALFVGVLARLISLGIDVLYWVVSARLAPRPGQPLPE